MVLVGTPSGVVKVNCIKRLLKSIRGHPWRLSPGDVQNEPGEVPTMVVSEPIVPEDELPPRMPKEREAESVSRRVFFKRNVELRRYGFTEGCREAVWVPRPVACPRIIRRCAGSGLNLPWRRMMLNERGSR